MQNLAQLEWKDLGSYETLQWLGMIDKEEKRKRERNKKEEEKIENEDTGHKKRFLPIAIWKNLDVQFGFVHWFTILMRFNEIGTQFSGSVVF